MQKKAPKKSNHKPASILQAKDFTNFLVKWTQSVHCRGQLASFRLQARLHGSFGGKPAMQIIPANCGRTHNINARMFRTSSRSISFLFLLLRSGAAKCASCGNLVVRRESHQRRSPEANIGNQLTAATKYWIFIIHIVSPFFIFVPEAVAAMSLTAKSKLLQRLLKKIGQQKVVRIHEPNLVHNHILWYPTCNTFV